MAEQDATSTDERVGGPTQLLLLVVGNGVYATEPLPTSGRVTIGRAHDSDVCIDDASISRDHAVLHVEPLAIEDSGSANGTFVREKRLERGIACPIAINEAVRIGSVTLIVQRGATRLHTRRIRTHAYFEDRLDDECARAARTRTTFVVLSLRFDSSSTELYGEIASCLRAGDLVAPYAPRELEVLLVDTDAERAERAVDRILEVVAARHASAKVGLAGFPRDGRDASTLMAAARDRAAGRSVQPITPGDLVVRDDRMVALYQLLERIAATDITVLLLGETGVGKEVVAETIHRRSARSGKPFLRLNCAALTETLLESELFGHEKGAFTGAIATKPGLFEVAAGGVVFLDEVGELKLETQAKLLRVLDERKVTRVGDVAPRPIDVRVIAATNRDLEADVRKGLFRLDLLYRLNAMSLVIPPLRERVDEIEPLARAFVAQIAGKLGMPAPRITPEARALLEGYSWPGNVRELRNVIERAIVLCSGSEITPVELPEDRMRATFQARVQSAPADTPLGGDERAKIIAALDACAGNQTEAAKMLGVSRRTLITKIEKLAVPRPRKR